MRINELISEAESLPVEERARGIDSLLRSMNPPKPAVDSRWAKIARQRLDDLRSGSVTPVPGEDVFKRIRERLEK